MGSNRFNVLYLHSHDTGRCMEPYGFPVAMPAYQKLAASGTVFRQAFSAAPTCSPSRAALLTGMASHSAGMLGLAHRGFRLTDPSRHLAAFLSSHGFKTVLAGHQHLTNGDPTSLGYDLVLDDGSLSGETIAEHAAAFLLGHQARDAEPCFLDVGFNETHRPFPEAEPGAERYVGVLPGQPDISDVRQDTARFHVSLRALDRAVGQVLEALQSSGLAERTIVILTTDHGPAFPGMKATLTDRGLGVGLILRMPQLTHPGSVIDSPVSQIDLFPTICAALGIAEPEWLQGVSLIPLLDRSLNSVRDEIFGEVTFHAAYEPQRSIRTDRWTFIRRFGSRALPVLPNIDESPALDWLIEHGWHERPRPLTELYDNAIDPAHSQNLAGLPDFEAVELELRLRLELWMRQTSDPLVEGSVSLPAGAITNRSSDRSADDVLVTEGFC